MGAQETLGIKFEFTGGDQVATQMDRMKSGFAGMSAAVDQHFPQAKNKMDQFAQSAHKMAQSVQSSMNMAKLAIAGVVTGKALVGLSNWVSGDAEAAKKRDFLRVSGAGPVEMEETRKHLKGLKRTIPGLNASDYDQGYYNLRSSMGDTDLESNKKAMEHLVGLAKNMGSNMTLEAASQVVRTFTGTYGQGKSPAELEKMLGKFFAESSMVIRNKNVTGHDIELAMSHVAGIYKEQGKSSADMLMDLSNVSEAVPGRGGEALMNIKEKEAEGYGKFMAKVDQYLTLKRRYGGATMHSLPRDVRHELHDAEKKREEEATQEAAELIKSGNMTEYGRRMKHAMTVAKSMKGFDFTGTMNQAYGATGGQAINKYIDSLMSKEDADLKKRMLAANPEEAMRSTIAGFQSIEAEADRFKSILGEIPTMFRKAFEPLGIGVLRGWGATVAGFSDGLEEGFKNLQKNADKVGEGFSAAFSTAFGDVDLKGKLKEWETFLKDPNPEAWKAWGTTLGDIAGISLAGLSDTFKTIGELASAMLPTLQSIATVLNTIKGAYGSVAGAAESGADWIDRKAGNFDAGYQKRHGPTVREYGVTRDAVAPGELPPGLVAQRAAAPWWGYGVGGPGDSGGRNAAAPPQINVQVTAMLDGDEISAKTASNVKEQIQADQDRNLDNSQAWGFATR